MSKNLRIVDLEYIESRYTAQWKTLLPLHLKHHLQEYDVSVIAGTEEIPPATTPGAFLNFGGTSVYKATQIEKIGRLFCDGSIKNGDVFLFTDFWHPGVIFVRYMSDLLKIHVKIHGLIHAGSYDPNDFLGRVEDKTWLKSTEEAMFHCFDYVWFATQSHIDLFLKTYPQFENSEKIKTTGWYFDFMNSAIKQDIKGIEKENIIVFPHRIAPEKQLWTFKMLEQALPEYQFIVAQEKNLTKKEYHQLLGRAKIVWSASLQETLGISTCIEGPLAGCYVLAPDHLSYSEIFEGHSFLYNHRLILSEENFKKSLGAFVSVIRVIMNDFDLVKPEIQRYNELRLPKYASFKNFLTFMKDA